MLDNIHHVAHGEHVVVKDRVLVSVKRHELAVKRLGAPGELGLVARLEEQDIELAALHHKHTRVLRRDCQALGELARFYVNHRDLVGRRERDIGFLVAGKGDSHRLVKARRLGRWVNVLDRGEYLKIGRALGVGVHHTHRVREMVGDPDLFAIGPNRDTDRLHSHPDALHDLPALGVYHVQRPSRRIGHKDPVATYHNRRGLRAHKRRVPSIFLVLHHAARGPDRRCD